MVAVLCLVGQMINKIIQNLFWVGNEPRYFAHVVNFISLQLHHRQPNSLKQSLEKDQMIHKI